MNKDFKIIAALSMGTLFQLLKDQEVNEMDLKNLHRRNLIEINKNGVYVLTAKGRNMLKEDITGKK